MPYVTQPLMLEAVFREVAERIRKGSFPTYLAHPGVPLFRAIDQQYATLNSQSLLQRSSAMENLRIRNAGADSNRFSGISHTTKIPPCGALYFSESEASLVNEHFWYARNKTALRDVATGFPLLHPSLIGKRVLKARVITPMQFFDLDTHSGYGKSFLAELERAPQIQTARNLSRYPFPTLLDALQSSTDCSVARGIGLAVAHSRGLQGLRVGTVRESDRSPDESGNNLVLFGAQDELVSGLQVESVLCFSFDSKNDFVISEHETEDLEMALKRKL